MGGMQEVGAYVLGRGCIYVFALKPLFNAVDSCSWGIAVYCCSLLVVKSGGEKFFVVLLRGAAHLPDVCDGVLLT